MKIGLTYDLREEYLLAGYGLEETAEFDRPDTIDAIESALKQLGYETDRIGRIHTLVSRLAAGDRWDLVFNIAEGLSGMGREAQVPALLEAYKIPYVFSDPLVLTLTLHKGMTKRVIRDLGIPTADFAVVESLADVDSIDLPYPLFAKPVAEGTGKGITAASRINTPAELKSICHTLLEKFKQPVLVETYLSGREMTVGIVGTGDQARSLGVMEVLLLNNAEEGVYSYDNKENCEQCVKYALTSDSDARYAEKVALEAWRGLGCRDGGRVDIRFDSQGIPNFIEVNPLAGLHPEHSDLPILCALGGIPYIELMRQIMDAAIVRLDGQIKNTCFQEKVCIPSTQSVREKVVLLHDKLADKARKDELDVLAQIDAVSAALARMEFDPVPLAFSFDQQGIIRDLNRMQPALVFNLVESVEGRDRLLYQAPALLDALGVPYTGSPAEAIFSTTNKVLAKTRLRAEGIATPDWVVADGQPMNGNFIPGQYILKAIWEHASVGLDDSSLVVAESYSELVTLLNQRQQTLGTECFAEAYIDGREFNLSILSGEDGPEVMPPAEIRFIDFPDDRPKMVGYAAKWDEDSFEYQNTPRCFDFPAEDVPLLSQLKAISAQCWRVFGMRGYARVDFRVDQRGKSWVLEVNANPCLSPDAGFAAAVEQAGIGYQRAIERILRDTAIAVPCQR